MKGTGLGREAARAFYQGFGERQDRQGWYEDPALDRLMELGRFEDAEAVVELGCGTGRLAARLLSEALAPSACYLGFDLAPRMAELTRRRWQASEPGPGS